MSKLIRGALLATFLCALPRCGGSEGAEGPGTASASQSTGGTNAGDGGSNAGASGAGDVAHGGRASAGAAGTSHVGGAAGTSTAGGTTGAGAAGMAGAAGAVSVVSCGGNTCGPNEYCRAPCNGTNIGFGGTTGLPVPSPMPSCNPLPGTCNGTPTCDCICGLGVTFWCSTGSKPLTPGPAVQCGCA